MVRAAATGAFNYTGSDPTNKHWRIKHRLIIEELLAQEDRKLFESVQRHWAGYVAHGNLTEESFETVKQRATDTLKKIKNTLFPWLPEEDENEKENEQNDTIKPEYAELIERYRKIREANAGKKNTDETP